ncbi:cAMP-binding domain of CRP or a regulatory subunit of cAMP-dependent protein kinases [Paracoccus isoporae]|uniref:cAMP-binding domain of CRP or a regulatory subunit of cAMP-dependent protein kinases n=1 Tax=Paracoccus isoporae TaxID=591205 RepID=A0A1G7CYG4_9RHOB|nr:Crp/Fnr family transcriptional regulator [Paracoccus isoporae]SDE43810.1 cAMP-binding domain of CRP or a regulatory subunit of cAMP-dependent protein kinases [Paracoccus isoporae]
MALSDYFIRFLERRDKLSDEERARLADITTERKSFASGDVIVAREVVAERSCLMLSGMSARIHVLPRSKDRVITALHVPGDFVDLHGFVLAGLAHTVIAMGPAEVEFVSHDQLRELTNEWPHLTRLLWMSTTIDAAVHRQWLVAAASLRSSAHLAHLLCELYTRLNSVGAAQDHRYILPLLQRDLANILGYSPIHINRAVRDLRERGLIRWSGTEVQILDWPGITALAQFRPDYLDLEQLNR